MYAAWPHRRTPAPPRPLLPPPRHPPLPACSAYKSRFKVTASGLVRYQRPGHVHKRFNKSRRRLCGLKGTKIVGATYTKVFKKLGFHLRR